MASQFFGFAPVFVIGSFVLGAREFQKLRGQGVGLFLTCKEQPHCILLSQFIADYDQISYAIYPEQAKRLLSLRMEASEVLQLGSLVQEQI